MVMEIKHYEEYLNKISPYLKDTINNLEKSDTWKIQLTVANGFISSIDNDKKCVMHSKSDKKKILMNVKADEVIEELFGSLTKKNQNNLESLKGSLPSVMFIDFIKNAINKSKLWWIIHKLP